MGLPELERNVDIYSVRVRVAAANGSLGGAISADPGVAGLAPPPPRVRDGCRAADSGFVRIAPGGGPVARGRAR